MLDQLEIFFTMLRKMVNLFILQMLIVMAQQNVDILIYYIFGQKGLLQERKCEFC